MPKKFKIYLNKNEYLKSKNLMRMLLLDRKLDRLPKILRKKSFDYRKTIFILNFKHLSININNNNLLN